MLDYVDHMQRFRKEYYRALEPVCRKWELTHNEADVVLFLRNHPGLDRASEIVARRGIAKSHVSQSVAALESRGFLRRTPDPADRRTEHLILTEAAAPMLAEAAAVQQTFFGALLGSLTPEDRENWNRIAAKLCAAIEQMEQSGKEA